jgi:2-iminobutanoate/2-iminopropanoate deaminase
VNPNAISQSDANALARRDIHPQTHPAGADTAKGYSFGVLVGSQLWISGQVPFDSKGELVGKDDIEAQAVQVHENLKSVVEAAGGNLEDIVKITTYLTDRTYRDPVHEVRRNYFPGPRHPTSATVIAEMIVPDVLVEVEAVAVLGARNTE